ncbi:MAG: type III secretion protein [Rhodobacteraceae bacterium]|nr:type III secretion protein [Paracoccaceae bacterium]
MAELISELFGGFWQGVAVFLRVSALISVLPILGEQSVPVRVKLGVSIALTFIVAPLIPPVSEPSGLANFALLTASEILIGLVFGLGVRLFVLALQTAGSIAGQATSLSQILGSAGMDPIPAMGQVLLLAGLALAVTAGLHIRAAEYLVISYELFAPGRFPDAQALSQWSVRRVADAFSLAFTLAAPFVMTSVVYNLALGAINRAMPQMMVAFVGAPVITFGGLFILFAASPFLLSVWIEAVLSFMANPMQVN